MTNEHKTFIGWKEWCAFPDLGLPAIKAKVDTGAKTSCLHAYDIEPFTQDGVEYVLFKVHPIQKNDLLEMQCSALLSDHRSVTSSNGEREERYIIKTPLTINKTTIETEVSLTSRHQMAFRMLLGRDSIAQANLAVDPAESFLLGKVSKAKALY